MWYEKQHTISSFSYYNKEKGLVTFYQENCYPDNSIKQRRQKDLYPKIRSQINQQRLSKDFSHSYLLKVLNESQKKQIKQERKTHDPHKNLLPKIHEQVYKIQRNQKKQKINEIRYRFNKINKTQHCKINKHSSMTLKNSKNDLQFPIQKSQNKIQATGVKNMSLQQNKNKNIDFDINEQQYLNKKMLNNQKENEYDQQKKKSNKNLSRAISESQKLFTNIVIKKSLEKIIQDRKIRQIILIQNKFNLIQFNFQLQEMLLLLIFRLIFLKIN